MNKTLSKWLLTGLGNGNDIMAHLDSRNAVALDGCGSGVTTQFDILQHDRVQTSSLKGLDGNNTGHTLLLNLNLGKPNAG